MRLCASGAGLEARHMDRAGGDAAVGTGARLTMPHALLTHSIIRPHTELSEAVPRAALQAPPVSNPQAVAC